MKCITLNLYHRRFTELFFDIMKGFRLLLVGVIIFVIGCTKKIDSFPIAFTEKLVVQLLATNDQVFSMHVGNTLAINDSTAEKIIDDAKVTVTNKLTGVVSTLKYNLANNRYESSWIPQTGVEYYFQISRGNSQSATCQLQIPSFANANKSTWKDSTGQDKDNFYTGTINVSINDNSNERNYYEISLYRYQDITQTFETMKIVSQNPELSQNSIINEFGAMILDDGNFNGQNKLLKFTTSFGSAGVEYKYLVVVKNLSNDYYTYFKSIDNYKQQTGVFSDPSPVFSNIRDGVGICAGASVYRDTIR